MNSISIRKILQKGNRVDYQYEISGEWEKYFNLNVLFFAEYSKNIESIPQSIAVLPLVGNVIVLASLFDAVIYVDEIDRDFCNCVEKFIGGYMQLSPTVHFKQHGLIVANKIVTNDSLATEENCMLFFSGGADAWFSLKSHLHEKPALVSIWGADLASNNSNGWAQAYSGICDVSERYGLELITIHSSLRSFINETVLNQFSFRLVNDNWWSAFQHSIGMMCLAAPIAVHNFRKLYFASTYSAKDKKEWGSYVIASDPLIDEHVRFAGARVIHDGYAFSRHDKIANLCEWAKDNSQKPYLRVCFSSPQGTNCGKCEKCVNTIMSILLSEGDPKDYGFSYDKEKLPYLFAAGVQEMAREEKYAFLSLYYDIHAAYRKKYTIEQVPDVLKVFYSMELETLADFLFVPCNKCVANNDLKVYLESVIEAKKWLEGQRDAWQRRAEDLEIYVKNVVEAKSWLEGQRDAWQKRAEMLESYNSKNLRIYSVQQKMKFAWKKIKNRIVKCFISDPQ